MKPPLPNDASSSDLASLSTKRKRTFRNLFKFNLRSLLLVLTICSLWMGWYVVRAQRQHAWVQAILRDGGGVIYSFRYATGAYSSTAKPPGPDWMRERLGLDYFDHVTHVDFNRAPISQLPDLSGLPRLHSLWIPETNVKDIEFVGDFSELKNLWLEGTKVTSLDPLSRNRKLEWISIGNTNIQDLSPLFKLPNLRTIVFSGATIPLEQINQFRAKQPRCEIINVDHLEK